MAYSPITIPIDELHRQFLCDPEAGKLIKRKPIRDLPAKREVGTLTPQGYLRATVCRKAVAVHRVIWAMHYGEWPKGQIDHKNGNRSDNRISNLRDCTPSQNQANRHVSLSNCGLKGIHHYPRKCRGEDRWLAKAGNRRTKLCKTREEAIAAYALMAREQWGEFANPTAEA